MKPITIQDVLNQAASTGELTGEEDLNALWDYAFRTYQTALEDEEPVDFTCLQLEAAFNARWPTP
jgi:hypothetical protein